MRSLNTTECTQELTQKEMDFHCYLQNGRTLEEYVEGFLQLYNEALRDNETLKHLLWSGMDDILSQMLLLGEDHHPFAEFVEYTLWLCRSTPLSPAMPPFRPQDLPASLVVCSSLAPPPPQSLTNSPAPSRVSSPPAKLYETDPLASTQAHRLHLGPALPKFRRGHRSGSTGLPLLSDSTLVTRHPGSTAEFWASGCGSALHPSAAPGSYFPLTLLWTLHGPSFSWLFGGLLGHQLCLS